MTSHIKMFKLQEDLVLVVTPRADRYNVAFLQRKHTVMASRGEVGNAPRFRTGYRCLGVLTGFGLPACPTPQELAQPHAAIAHSAMSLMSGCPWRDFGNGELRQLTYRPDPDETPASWTGQEKAWYRVNHALDQGEAYQLVGPWTDADPQTWPMAEFAG